VRCLVAKSFVPVWQVEALSLLAGRGGWDAELIPTSNVNDTKTEIQTFRYRS
jgi:hypothetical protein